MTPSPEQIEAMRQWVLSKLRDERKRCSGPDAAKCRAIADFKIDAWSVDVPWHQTLQYIEMIYPGGIDQFIADRPPSD